MLEDGFEVLLSKKNFSYKKLDVLSKHVKGKWTWQGAGLLALAKRGFEVINIENLDYKKFAELGDTYLTSIWSQEVFEVQNRFSNLKQEQRVARHLSSNINIKLFCRVATVNDVEKYFAQGFLVLVSVNPCVLDRKNCYYSHIVLITDISRGRVVFHDPGLPPYENRSVSRKVFERAMNPPWKEDTNIIAIKK